MSLACLIVTPVERVCLLRRFLHQADLSMCEEYLRSGASTWWDQEVLETREAAAVFCSPVIAHRVASVACDHKMRPSFFLTCKKRWQSFQAYTPSGHDSSILTSPRSQAAASALLDDTSLRDDAVDTLHRLEDEIQLSSLSSTMPVPVTCSQGVREADGPQEDSTV